MSDRWWHAYQADLPDLSPHNGLGSALAFTVVDTPQQEAPRTYQGTIFGHELTFAYVTTWDHEPSKEEKEAVQLKEKKE